MKIPPLWLAAPALGIGLASGALLSLSLQDTFPHADHVGLFPTCVGCHSGVPEGDESTFFSVDADACAECHDGEREDEVEWAEPARQPSNLVFSHPDHADAVEAEGDASLECWSCHQSPGAPVRMAVERAAPATCNGCHDHEAEDHLAAEVVCATCHVPLVEAGALSEARVAEFPQPRTHEDEAFVTAHPLAVREEGPESASCSVCHARQSCARCHLNADELVEIQALQRDDRIAALVASTPGEWPEPADHENPDWAMAHGAKTAESVATCANCHAAPSCEVCHGVVQLPAIAALPRPVGNMPMGAVVVAELPAGHSFDFRTTHGAAASSELPNCGSCHVDRECAQCHEGRFPYIGSERLTPSATTRSADDDAVAEDEWSRLLVEPSLPGYHPANFVLRHGAEAWAVQAMCSDCHSTEVFCRSCHENGGFSLGEGEGVGGAFHDAKPSWLLDHGQAARQGMESCASCHQQSSCLRCHSAKFGLRINPHGSGFDARRVAKKSTMSCGICHPGTILDGLDNP